MQSLTAYFFCQCFRSLSSYRYRLSCYLRRTFRAWPSLTWFAFKQYNSWTDPFRKRWTSLYSRRTCKARFAAKLSSQNTVFCHEKRAMWRFSSPVSMVYAWNAWVHDPPFGDQNACILWLGLSYGSPSKHMQFIKLSKITYRLCKFFNPWNIPGLTTCSLLPPRRLCKGKGRKECVNFIHRSTQMSWCRNWQVFDMGRSYCWCM